MDLDRKKLIRTFALTIMLMAFAMVPSLVYALFENDANMINAFGLPIAFSIIISVIILIFVKPSSMPFKVRNGYIGIFLIIISSTILGAFPYWLGIPSTNFIDAFFESTAGLSTTSATVLYEPSMSHSLLLWKAIEHWIGGIILLILVISIIPSLGVGDQQIATAEAHGTFMNRIAPKRKTIIKYLIFIYLTLTILAFVYFLLTNIGKFDALILSLSTSSTSGLLLHPEGISYYNSIYVEFGVSLFSILSGISFVFYIHFYKKNYIEAKRNIEIKVFFLIISLATLIVGIILFLDGTGKSLLTSLRDSFFQIASFSTTSGFSLEDYTLWPAPTVFIMFSLMIVGGCSASTTGSLKVIRLLITMKLISRGFLKRIHPRAVKAVKVGNSRLSSKMVSSVTTFAILYFATLLFSTVILSLQNLDLETTFSAAIGTMSNSGISMGEIGMSGNYSMFNPILKIYLSFLMIVGRLGFLTVFIVFLPSFWNPNKRIVQ